jgi:hypothetical protein
VSPDGSVPLPRTPSTKPSLQSRSPSWRRQSSRTLIPIGDTPTWGGLRPSINPSEASHHSHSWATTGSDFAGSGSRWPRLGRDGGSVTCHQPPGRVASRPRILASHRDVATVRPRQRQRVDGPPRGSRTRQRVATSALARELQERPSLRRPIVKPCKIAVKGALRDPCGPLDRDSCQGFTGRLLERWHPPSAGSPGVRSRASFRSRCEHLLTHCGLHLVI